MAGTAQRKNALHRIESRGISFSLSSSFHRSATDLENNQKENENRTANGNGDGNGNGNGNAVRRILSALGEILKRRSAGRRAEAAFE